MPRPKLLLASRSQTNRAGAQLDGSRELQFAAIKAQHLDLPLRSRLIQERAVVLALGDPLAPVADLGLRDKGQLSAVHPVDLEEPEIVEERRVLRLMRAVDAVHR